MRGFFYNTPLIKEDIFKLYKKVSTSLNFVDRELKVLDFWKENKIFEKSIEIREGNPTFTFYDGPPTANGKPHIGHIITRSIKDTIPRYRTMKGFKVLRKAGWDTHGLPVEIEVEKELGINGKPEIEKYGIEPFINKCKESVWKYEKEWRKISDRVGFWADMDNPYVTYYNTYIESVWWALKQIWDKGLLYKGYKVVPYCPRCGTSLSSHEVAQGYKDVKEPSIYVKFKVKGEDGVYFLAWTTTPWTLPSNVALTVNPKESYVKVNVGNEIYILAESLLNNVLNNNYKILERKIGSELVGIEYEPLYDFADVDGKAYFVVSDDFVTLSEGTGIVHTAPAFGEDDARVGMKYNLPFVQLVDENGKFKDEAFLWKGIFVKDADPEIIKDLDERHLIYKIEDYEHSYPFCWRCDTPLLYYARNTWYIKTTAVKDKMIENNKKINWIPESIRDGRFGNFLENNIDWALSRERYWGTPLPIWECECGYKHLVGSISELKEMSGNVPDDIELHKPYIDNVFLNCPKCGTGKMKRVSEVIDCWFDSGSMPFAQWHYPFENEELFKSNFPADFISEAIDQTRGWFYTLHAICTIIFNQPAYKNCIVLGLVQDKDGQKMSKHKGNVIDPWTVLDKEGADAIRWYFYTGSAPWLPNRFYEEAVSEVQRKFMGTLWNTYAFYVLYAEIDKFNPFNYELEYEKLSVMDKWVLSKLHSLIKFADENLENYHITEAARAIEDFTDDLSNWYVRRSRERFWQKGMEQDKINAYMTLYSVLNNIAKISAPFIPFMTEEIYRNISYGLNASLPLSIHLCDYPEYNERYIDQELEKNMEAALRIVVLGRAARNSANIKTRQPLSRMYVKTDFKLPDVLIKIIEDELNVKKIDYIDDTKCFVEYKIKPQLKVLGPKYGKLMPKINVALNELDGQKVVESFNRGESLTLEIEGRNIELLEDELLIEKREKEGLIFSEDRGITVIMDINLTSELIEEGFVRELISKIQTMRKEAGFEVEDRIKLFYKENKRIAEIIQKNNDVILDEILANELIEGDFPPQAYAKDWNINGEFVKLAVMRMRKCD